LRIADLKKHKEESILRQAQGRQAQDRRTASSWQPFQRGTRHEALSSKHYGPNTKGDEGELAAPSLAQLSTVLSNRPTGRFAGFVVVGPESTGQQNSYLQQPTQSKKNKSKGKQGRSCTR